jgi:hypothetical protein
VGAVKNFQEEKPEIKKSYPMWVCPGCGKTVHIDRQYCDCHTRLDQAAIRMAEEPPEYDRCNFEMADLTCADCPENCEWCPGFGTRETNSAGFGGKDCLHRNTLSARCSCCLDQVTISDELKGIKLMGSRFKNFKDMTDYIRSTMKKPILDRIRKAQKDILTGGRGFDKKE